MGKRKLKKLIKKVAYALCLLENSHTDLELYAMQIKKELDSLKISHQALQGYTQKPNPH
jgi:hypothetical protein